MDKLRYLTAGESHGKALIGILEGVPAGLKVIVADIDIELRRRQQGYGRGGRMKIENDHAEIISGVRNALTMGGPISLIIENADWENWKEKMAVEEITSEIETVTVPRPGHADLAGHYKFGHKDLRNVIERSSARETAMRVGLGAIAKLLLSECGITIGSHVISINGARLSSPDDELSPLEINELADASRVRCIDDESSEKMVDAIKLAVKNKDTVGGVFEVVAAGLPTGLGSYTHWDRKLDGRIAKAVMSIPAIKGVEIGPAFDNAALSGSQVHDEILPADGGDYVRPSNRAGGLEGGVTNGQPIVVRAAMKPISTLRQPLKSVDLSTGKKVDSRYERSDVCAVPAAAVIGEAMLALVLADALLEKFGGDSMEELLARVP
ncbi:MAG: chorismate synthase, partial [Candidatus Marinimicrobia bacterium]|nr:chorismate synthase [Candidatus Neomarinimicrobiota bacterium]